MSRFNEFKILFLTLRHVVVLFINSVSYKLICSCKLNAQVSKSFQGMLMIQTRVLHLYKSTLTRQLTLFYISVSQPLSETAAR